MATFPLVVPNKKKKLRNRNKCHVAI